APEDMARFTALCERERCPWADLGQASDDGQHVLADRLGERPAVDMPLEVLLGTPTRMHRDAVSVQDAVETELLDGVSLDEMIDRVLALPAVGSKQFLVTFGDRTVGGLTARYQIVGPYQ